MFIGLAVRLLPNWEHLVLACPRCIFVMVSIFWSISPNLPGNGCQIMANLVWPETNPGYYPHDVQTSKVLKHTGKLGHSLKTFFLHIFTYVMYRCTYTPVIQNNLPFLCPTILAIVMPFLGTWFISPFLCTRFQWPLIQRKNNMSKPLICSWNTNGCCRTPFTIPRDLVSEMGYTWVVCSVEPPNDSKSQY